MGRRMRVLATLTVAVLLLASIPGMALAGSQNGSLTSCHDDGFWKSHPEAWPVSTVTVGSVTYTKAEAIAILKTRAKGDMTYVMWREVLCAQLNIAAVPNAPYLSPHAFDLPREFLANNPLGSGVTRSSTTWSNYSAAADLLHTFNNWRR